MFVFAAKTLLYGAVPFLFARYRRQRAERRKEFDFQRDMAPVRRKHHGRGGWQAGVQGAFRFRDYASYDEYLEHQAEKYSEMLKVKGGIGARVIVYYRLKFFDRFRRVARRLPKDALIVCAGARDGTEVEVWRDMGFGRAIGVDLNPGPGNPLVVKGDFNHLPYEDDTVDLIYSNCIDHSFDFDLLFREARRVLKPGGYVLYEIAVASGGGFEAVDWRRPEDVVAVLLNHFDALVSVRRLKNWMCVLMRKDGAATGQSAEAAEATTSAGRKAS